MTHVLGPGVTLTALLLALASPATAGNASTAASKSPPAATSSSSGSSALATPSAGNAGLTRPVAAEAWTSWTSPWSVLPSRFDDWSWSALRVEWDPEAAAWGLASAPDVATAGVFGARLPSDRPVQITRADGTVMLLTGPEGMEFLSVHRGPDGRFHPRCGQNHDATAAPDAAWPEK